MTTQFQPPPTYADPVVVNETTKRGQFNPIWLKWFLDITQFLSNNGGTTNTIQHNATAGLQGGQVSPAEYYHLTQASYTFVSTIGTPTAGAVAYGDGATIKFSLAGTSGYFLKSGGAGTPTWSNSIGGYVVDGTTPYLDFANGAAVTNAAGRMWYDGVTGSWNLGMGGGNITQQVGEELFRYGKASSAISDTNLQIVYKTGVVGASGVIKFAPTIAGITDPDQIIGVATEPIALNAFGRVTTYGVVHGINTTGSAYGETWADNDDIWYNPVTGNPTKTKPSAPNIKLQIGTVINAGSGGSGSFVVRLGQTSALGGTDSNVQLGTLANGDLLQYDSTAQYWKNVSVASVLAGGSGAPVTKTADFTVGASDTWIINNKSGSTCTATLPTASTNTGRVLHFQNYQAQTVVSASSNVVPIVGGAASTAILEAVAGDTCTLVSDGTNWIMTQYTPNNVLLI